MINLSQEKLLPCSPINGNEFSTIIEQYFDRAGNPFTNLEEFIHVCEETACSLPINVRMKIIEFLKFGNQEGYLLINNLKLDPELPHTPISKNEMPNKKTFYSECWLTIFANLLGEPFSYKQEGNGLLFHNICPSKSNQNLQSSLSSDVLLDLHTEVAFSPFIMDFVLLYCLREDRNHYGKTLLVSIRDIYKHLSSEAIDELKKRNFKAGIDFSFGSKNPKKYYLVSVLYGDKEDPFLVYDRDLFKGQTESAQKALVELENVIMKHIKGISLKPGDLLIIDNRRVVHGRTSFTAYYDGYDRWLQRLFVCRTLTQAAIIFSKRERIISYEF